MDPRSAARAALCVAAGLTLVTAVAARADVEPPVLPAERLRGTAVVEPLPDVAPSGTAVDGRTDDDVARH